MAKKDVYDGDLDASMDFAAAGPNGEPASGLAVQNYIKKKIGVGYTVENGTEHLFFADEVARDAYIADPSREDLIIDRLPLESMYHMSYNLLSDIYNYLFVGGTGNVIRYTFETTNKSGGIIAEPVTVTYTIVRGGTKQVVTMRYGAGTEVAFNVDKYLLEGTNSITVAIRGQLSNVGVSFSVVYQVISLSLVDSVDISRVYRPNSGDTSLAVPYVVSGAGQKTMEWYIDSDRVPFNRAEDEINDSVSSRTKYINIVGLEQGRHTLQFRVGIVVNGETFYSEIHYREFIISLDQIGDPIVTTAVNLPIGASILGVLDPLVISPTQYEAFNLRLGVFNPDGTYQNTVVVAVDGTTVSSVVCSEGVESTVPLTLAEEGEGVLTLGVGSSVREISLDVQATSLDIHEITADLQMNFTAEGKSNESSDKATWTDGTNHATLTGFDWTNVSGWVANRLVIPSGAHIDFDLAPLAINPAIDGKTIELEFRTINVDDDNATLIDLINSTTGAGIKVTATEVFVKSQGGLNLSRRYKTDEDLRVSIVINRRQNSTYAKLVQVYFNGVLSITQNFASSDQFTAPNLLSVGGIDAGMILRQIRIYNAALDADAIVNNFTLYRPTVDEMLAVYERNDLYGQGVSQFDIDKIAGFLPVMIITGDLTPIETATDTKATTVVDIDYTNLQNPDYSFRMYHAQMRPQGTSSLTYPRKNLRLYTQKRDDTIVYDSTGKVIESKLYAFKEGAQPVNCWTLKADFAESSSTHNTGVARLWNHVLKQAQLGGEYVLRTEAQQTALDNDFPYDVRTTVDGFPIVIFHRLTEDDPLTFLGKYNFNNDKSTESVFGFKGIPGFDNTNVQCWEFRDSGFDLALFKTPTSGRTYAEEFDYYAADYEHLFKQVWESRYPDTSSPSYDHFRRLALWINSTEGAAVLDNNPSSPTYGKIIPGDADKFAEWQQNKSLYFDLPKLASYYVYLMRFGAVDQTVKNSMITTEDGNHWYFILYDNDTILGVRNDGLLKYGPEIDRQSPDPELGGYAYAGHDSVLWNNFEADPECMEMARNIDSALFTAGLTYAEMIKMFNVDQAGKWAEKVYNKDAMYKYIEPYLYQDKNYLGSLQGSRSDHRKWWISNRFSLYDALYANEAYNSNAITMLIPNARIGDSFSIVAGKDFYYGWGQNRQPMETGVHVGRGETHQFVLSMNFEIGTPLRIYAPHYIQRLDLSGLMEYIGATNFNLAPAYSVTLGSKMKTLILGISNPTTDLRRNTALSSPSGLAMILTLEELNVAGFMALTTLNLSTLTNLRVFRGFASGLTSVQFANGAPLTQIELPVALQVLALESLPALQASGIILEEDTEHFQARGRNIYSIDVRNCPNVSNSYQWLLTWLTGKATPDSECSVYIDNVNWRNMDPDDLITIGQLLVNGGSLTLRGTAALASTTLEQVNELMDIFGPSAFQPGAAFRITAPAAVYITGRTEVLEGETEQYRAVIFSDSPGTLTWSIYSGSRTGTSIDAETGLLTTTETGSSTSNLTIQALFRPQEGSVTTARLPIQVVQRTYPSANQVSISGPSLVTADPARFAAVTTGSFTGNMVSLWEVTGDLAQYVQVVQDGALACLVSLIETPSDIQVSGSLSLTLKKAVNEAVICTKTKAISYVNDTIAISRATNPIVMTAVYNGLHSLGLCENADYMTKAEAARVTELDIQPGTAFSSSIFQFSSYVDFPEFQYFTGLSELPKYTFGGYKLRSIIFPSTIVTFKEYSCYQAFYSQAEFRLVLPSGTRTIEASAFAYCSLAGVSFNAGLEVIGNSAFNGNHLDSVILPDSVTSVGSSAFLSQNSHLKTIHIGRNTVLPGLNYGNTFDSGVVEAITVDADNPGYYGNGNNCIVTAAEHCLICGCENTVIPTTVVKIGIGAFHYVAKDSANPKTLEIPASVTEIGNTAFQYCGLILSLPSSITTIGSSAFQSCTGLDTVNLANLTSVSSSAFANSSIQYVHNLSVCATMLFSGCTRLKNFHLGPGVTYIDRVIDGCTAMETITVDPNNSTFEGNGYNCIIKKSQYLPGIAAAGFASTDYAKAIVYGCKNTVIPNDVGAIYGPFVSTPDNMVLDAGNIFYLYRCFYENKTIKSLTITLHRNMYRIAELTYGATALEKVYIRGNYTVATDLSVGRDMNNLEEAVLECKPSSLGNFCFYAAGSQESATVLDIPDSVTSITTYALAATATAVTIICRAVTPPTCSSANELPKLANTAHIYVPAESVEAYKAASIWSTLASKIEAIPAGIFIVYTDGTRSNYDTLDAGKTPVGVAVIDSQVSFVIHPDQIEATGNYYSNNVSSEIPGVTAAASGDSAVTDFAGKQNTANAIASGDAGPLFTSAVAAVYADGRTGYLPALGQLKKIYENKTNIDVAMGLIGGHAIDQNYGSSTQKNAANYWRASRSSPYYVTNNIAKTSQSYGRSISDYSF